MFRRASALVGHIQVGTFGFQGQGGPGVTLSERHPLDLVHISGARSGLSLPDAVNTSTTEADTVFLWLGPDRALAVSETPKLLDRLETNATKGTALNDVSSGRSVFRVAGPRAGDVLAAGTPIDLHPDAFPVGASAPTLHGHLNVLIHRVDGETFDVYVARSLARDLWHALTEAAREWGYRVEA